MTPAEILDPPDELLEWHAAYRRFCFRNRGRCDGADLRDFAYDYACKTTGFTPENIEEEYAD